MRAHVFNEPAATSLTAPAELEAFARANEAEAQRDAFWSRFAARAARHEILLDKPYLLEANSPYLEQDYTPESETTAWTPNEAEALAASATQGDEPSTAGGNFAQDVYPLEGLPPNPRACKNPFCCGWSAAGGVGRHIGR